MSPAKEKEKRSRRRGSGRRGKAPRFDEKVKRQRFEGAAADNESADNARGSGRRGKAPRFDEKIKRQRLEGAAADNESSNNATTPQEEELVDDNKKPPARIKQEQDDDTVTDDLSLGDNEADSNDPEATALAVMARRVEIRMKIEFLKIENSTLKTAIKALISDGDTMRKAAGALIIKKRVLSINPMAGESRSLEEMNGALAEVNQENRNLIAACRNLTKSP